MRVYILKKFFNFKNMNMILKEKDIFIETFRQAGQKLDESFNFPDIIPYGRKLIEIIEKNESKTAEFEQIFIHIWEHEQGPNELIAFCMHKLKWDSLQKYFRAKHEEALRNENWRAWHCLEDILDAFNDSWEDAQDFYAEYFNNRPE